MQNILTLLPLVFVCCFAKAQSEPIPDSNLISGERICHMISELADDSFQGRKPGTEGETMTISYLKDRFSDLGLEPGYRGDWFQPVTLREYTTMVPNRIQLYHKGNTSELLHRDDFYLASTSQEPNVRIDRAEVVFCGFGISAPELGWDDYKNKDVTGNVVVVLADSPDQYTTDSTLWKGDPGANLYSRYFYKIKEAASRGAIGLLVVFKDKGPGQLNWSILDRTSGQPKMTIPKGAGEPELAFSGYIHAAAAEKLFALCNKSFTSLRESALNKTFKPVKTGIRLSTEFENHFRDLQSHNVVALKRGTDLQHEVLVYSAHWDHEGINMAVGGDSIYNGAVDNASGTAMLLEIARAYRAVDTRRSILFLATTAEEMGLLGSIAYNKAPAFPIGNTVANFNMDAHFPYGRTGLAVGVVYGRSELDRYIDTAAAWTHRVVIPNPSNARDGVFFRSDHYPFVEQGIPSTFLVGAAEPWDLAPEVHQEKMAAYMGRYHQPTDAYDTTFDCRGIAQDARLVFYTGWQLANSTHFPQWHPGQPYRALRAETRQNERG